MADWQIVLRSEECPAYKGNQCAHPRNMTRHCIRLNCPLKDSDYYTEARMWRHKYEGLSQALEAMVSQWAERASERLRTPPEPTETA